MSYQRISLRDRAFSLIEVVLAIGIVSFALLAIVGLFGSLQKQAMETAKSRDVQHAASSLRLYLNDIRSYTDVYSWMATAPRERTLVHLTYGVDAAGNPIPPNSAVRTTSGWFDAGTSGPELIAANAAREGFCVKAVIRLDDALNPVSTLPSDSATYLHPYLVLKADFHTTSDVSIPLPPGDAPVLRSVLTVSP